MARLFVQIVLQGTNLLPCSLWHCQRNLPSGISALPIFKAFNNFHVETFALQALNSEQKRFLSS
jgi:hypothetical protein